ncbi:hypothetical protein Taro_001688 [Colocasia esculenta]|uniref:Uncharacterized protein n=1 Tax=Colocasia esculenta TaxID=4460 RepID=A0A843TGX9_COLES|nr:hypothetical protein [Colocasia esculenta]
MRSSFREDRTVWWLKLHATLWTLSGERNSWIFRRISHHEEALLDAACARVKEWAVSFSPTTSHQEACRFVAMDITAQLCLRIVQWLEGLASEDLDLEKKGIPGLNVESFPPLRNSVTALHS